MKKVLVIKQATLNQCQSVIEQNYGFSHFEIRIDALSIYNDSDLKQLLSQQKQPIILTLRTKEHGGSFSGNYQQQITRLAELLPDYLDVEEHVGPGFIQKLKENYPKTKIIQSLHLPNTPKLLKIDKSSNADIFKVITQAQNSLDALRVMHFAKANPEAIIHAAGEAGMVTRLFAVILQQPLIFINGSKESSLEYMQSIYKIEQITPATRLLALIGTPITHSLGRFFHNERLSGEAVYVNIPLESKQLPEFFKLISGLPFSGFSVTMPLKQDILSFVETDLDAVNTLCNHNGEWQAYNTDGFGVIAAVGNIEGNVLLIGAGGSAVAVARVLKQKSANFSVLNRTLSKAKIISENAYDFLNFADYKHQKFDLIINATPNSAATLAFISEIIRPYVNSKTKYLGLDYRTPLEPNLDVQIICPKVLFYEQAAIQLKLFKSAIAEGSASLV